MSKEHASQFFEPLGEIWRDVTAIEFLMRCAIAKSDKEANKIPKPPYTKGREYEDYPDSFSTLKNFETIASKFNKCFPHIAIPKEFIDWRHAMAHGIIAQIDGNNFEQIVKFKEMKIGDKKRLTVEFSMFLEPEKLAQIRQSLVELRSHIMKEAADDKGK